MSTQENWTTFEDVDVRLIWQDPESGEEIAVSPDWHQDNGTPINNEGEDYIYVRTEVNIQEHHRNITGWKELGCVVDGTQLWERRVPPIEIGEGLMPVADADGLVSETISLRVGITPEEYFSNPDSYFNPNGEGA